jgi:hypothetical protein
MIEQFARQSGFRVSSTRGILCDLLKKDMLARARNLRIFTSINGSRADENKWSSQQPDTNRFCASELARVEEKWSGRSSFFVMGDRPSFITRENSAPIRESRSPARRVFLAEPQTREICLVWHFDRQAAQRQTASVIHKVGSETMRCRLGRLGLWVVWF